MKAISKQASKKLQNGCRLQQVLSLSTVVVVFAILLPCHSSMNFFTSNPVMFLASEPQISQRLSPLILNHASAHWRCAAPSSSLQPHPSRITSDPPAAAAAGSSPPSGLRWQIRQATPWADASTSTVAAAGARSTSITTASALPTSAAGAMAASRRIPLGSGRGEPVGRGCCEEVV